MPYSDRSIEQEEPMRRATRHRRSLYLVFALAVAAAGSTAAAHAAASIPLVDTGLPVGVGVARVPGDGYLVAWQDPSTFRLRARRISASGIPGDEVGGLPELPFDFSGPAVAVAPSGRWLVVWTQPAGADQIGLAGALFDEEDLLVRLFELPDPIPDPGGLVISSGGLVAALPGGGFAVALTIGIQEDPLADPLNPSDTDAYVLRLDDQGLEVGGAVRLHADAEDFQVATDVGASGAGIVVAWTSWSREIEDDREALVRVFGLDLSPLSGEVAVNESPIPPDVAAGSVDLAVGPDGRFVVAWEGEAAGGGVPDVFLRAFDAAGDAVGAEARVGSPGISRAIPSADAAGDGVVWVVWVDVLPPPAGPLPVLVVRARPYDLSGTAEGAALAVETIQGSGPAVVAGDRGALVVWPAGADVPIVLGQVVGLAPEETRPPPELALESPELPGFRVWVRIGHGDLGFVWGTGTSLCLAEALCAAGAIPDRAEVIVRVVGPKPNGFLWPTIVKLSTSRIEVWIEQLATGAVQYYLLPGATPGSELLPGLFDRNGFEP
jgi:hypothetical protein